MAEAYFYHMTRTPLEATLPALLGKALDAGWRVVVRGVSDVRLGWLDERLWAGAPDSFLPHGVAGGAQDAAQPVLLTLGTEVAACLVSVDGAEISPDDIKGAARTMVLFDGNDEQAVERARGQWRSLTEAGIKAKYWSQESGRWALKAESGAG